MDGLVNLGACTCGQKIFADPESSAIIHELPYCENFAKMDVIEFMRYVRKCRGVSDN